MTREEAIKRLKELHGDGDPECSHSVGDAILCALLVSLGYQDVVDEWSKITRWYA